MVEVKAKTMVGYVVERWVNQAGVDQTNAAMKSCIDKSKEVRDFVNPFDEYVPIWEKYIEEHQAPHWEHKQSFESKKMADEKRYQMVADSQIGDKFRIVKAEIMIGNATRYTIIEE